jgi:two-component system alkaline phosphatase synthesis response regulator PhoP
MAKILIVDDDEQITALFEKYLGAEGHQTVAVNISSQAIAVAVEFDPDLFILDLMMPDPDGFKLCRMLRTFSQFIDTPILIVTALSDEDSRAVAFGAGADDYLTKPFVIDELGRRVKGLLL